MNVKSQRVGHILIVRLDGEFDMTVADEFRSVVDGYLTGGRPTHLLLDLKEVTFIDSSGLGAVLGRYKKVTALGGEMIISGAGPQVRKVFEVSGVNKIMSLVKDYNSALKELS